MIITTSKTESNNKRKEKCTKEKWSSKWNLEQRKLITFNHSKVDNSIGTKNRELSARWNKNKELLFNNSVNRLENQETLCWISSL